MADESNVITFPRAKKPIPKSEMPTAQEIQANIATMKEGEIVDITEALASLVMETITASGFALNSSQENFPMICMFVESLKAVVSQQYGTPHPFHEIAKNCFVTNENGDMIFREPSFRFSETPIEIPAETAEQLGTDPAIETATEVVPEGGV